MRRALTVAALSLAATAAGLAPSQAITGNYEKDTVHTYVAMLVFYTEPAEEGGDPFSHRCTGSLLDDGVTIVTAGHCTEGVDEGRAYFQQAAAPNYDPEAFDGRGGDPTTGYPYVGGVTFSQADNYGFHDFEGYPENKDVGVVVLDEPVTTSNRRYAELPEAGALNDYVASVRKKQNVRFTLSGYGLSGTTPTPTSTRERLTGTSALVNDRAPITRFNLKTSANPAQGKAGTCSGDSGGPVLARGSDTVLAVTSFGMNAKCRGLDFSYRLDRKVVLDWIADPNRLDAG
ncbi:trypsin-like serine protease [Nocardioides sp. HDW12B]|uniref:trypsin-like serine protease n=1 Tax=Nocardioides sp. HDW12B TaxID=2714939 RepID=UPI00140DE941|nr:trypsin-like serine protease [Nocardioides sp. HDW12B]QIK66391.1 trypsin-like serine protease [Nocardioides sp. HDW12B]